MVSFPDFAVAVYDALISHTLAEPDLCHSLASITKFVVLDLFCTLCLTNVHVLLPHAVNCMALSVTVFVCL